MRPLFYKFWKNILNSFRGFNLIYHLLAIILTYIIVVSDFDWKYFQFFRGTQTYHILFSAAIVGGLTPVFAPLIILLFGKLRKNTKLLNIAFALGQSAILGSLISSFYKAFTGRAHPSIHETLNNIDITHIFNFGFLRGGIFWGWPSSHTMIAFSMVFTLWALYPKNKTIKILTLIYALYIGIGVPMTIHWFSDFVAGAIIGIVIGIVVGKAFKERIEKIII